MKRVSSLWFLICLGIVVLAGCATQTKVVRPDWQNPDHRRVGAQVVSLLRSVGRDPHQCKVFFIEMDKLNAVSLGNCTFGFTTGLISTGDERLIRGIAAHEVAHEVLGHADKRKAAVAAEQAIRTAVSFIPGVGGLVATGAVLVAGMLALPAYSRSQEAEADDKAAEILQAVGDADPAGTMIHTFRALLDRHGARGGGLLDSHPGTEKRLEAMRKLQSQPSVKETSPPHVIAREPSPAFAGPSSESLDPTSGRGSTGQPPSGDTVGGLTARIEPGSSPRPTVGRPVEITSGTAPSGFAGIEQLGRSVSVHELSQRARTSVVLVYREGSHYSERFEEHLKRVAVRFADRASFFRSEIATTAPDLVGPGAITTPILIVFREGKERARITGLPPNRRHGAPAEETLAEWLADHLKKEGED